MNNFITVKYLFTLKLPYYSYDYHICYRSHILPHMAKRLHNDKREN